MNFIDCEGGATTIIAYASLDDPLINGLERFNITNELTKINEKDEKLEAWKKVPGIGIILTAMLLWQDNEPIQMAGSILIGRIVTNVRGNLVFIYLFF